MRQAQQNLTTFQGGNLPKLAAVAVLLFASWPAISQAQQPGQKTFPSAEAASMALVTATQNNDEKAMLEIFGTSRWATRF